MNTPISFPLLRSGASAYGITLDDEALSRFDRYSRLLTEWNARMNLVSARDMDRLVEYHFLDSLKIASVFNFSTVHRVLDFGAGAGFPGIPLAIAFPHLEITLLDSREKRCQFLTEAVAEVGPGHSSVIRSRIEELPCEYTGAFDLVVTRATVKLSDFFHLCSRFISGQGSLISIKGDIIGEELRGLSEAAHQPLFHISATAPVVFDGVRTGHIVTVTKTGVIHNRTSSDNSR